MQNERASLSRGMGRGGTIVGVVTAAWTPEDLLFLTCQTPTFIWRNTVALGYTQSCLLFYYFVWVCLAVL